MSGAVTKVVEYQVARIIACSVGRPVVNFGRWQDGCGTTLTKLAAKSLIVRIEGGTGRPETATPTRICQRLPTDGTKPLAMLDGGFDRNVSMVVHVDVLL